MICGLTRAMSVKNMRKLEGIEMRILRLKCAIRLQVRITSADLQNRYGIESVLEVTRSILSWFKHVMRKPEEGWVKIIVT